MDVYETAQILESEDCLHEFWQSGIDQQRVIKSFDLLGAIGIVDPLNASRWCGSRSQDRIDYSESEAEYLATGEDNVTSDPTSFGLYDESNIHNLAFGQPLLSHDAGTGMVSLNFQIEQSPDLATPWAPVPTITPTFNGTTKEIEAVFDPPPGSAYFFRLYGSNKAAPPP